MRHIDTIVLVKDIARSKAFYGERLHLAVQHDWGSMVIFSNRLALHQADLLQPRELLAGVVTSGPLGCGNLVLYFETPTLEEDCREMERRGVAMVHGITALPWGRIFRVRDPDGHLIEIGEAKTA